MILLTAVAVDCLHAGEKQRAGISMLGVALNRKVSLSERTKPREGLADQGPPNFQSTPAMITKSCNHPWTVAPGAGAITLLGNGVA